MRAQTRDLPPRVIRFPHLQQRGHPPSARYAQSDRRAGLAAGHAPRRAGPEPGAAALVGSDRGRHHDGNHHTRYAQRPAAAKRRASAGRVPWGQGAVPGQPPSG